MLASLLGNAIKFTAAGQIVVQASGVALTDGSALLKFAVTDTGSGIAADKMSLLFEPFSQADSSTTRQFGGSGLGLSIVSSLARLLGGDVGAKSELGQGSRFWFRVTAERALTEFSTLSTSACNPDLILMDLQMPVMDGYAASRAIRQWEKTLPGSRTPIIALTADAFLEDRQRCRAAGMDDVLTKPIALAPLAPRMPYLSRRWTGRAVRPRWQR